MKNTFILSGQHKRCYYQQYVFTMIELLVVIAIIAILAAILLPALKNVKDYGVRISCLNNERQLHLTCINYINDMDSYYPVHWYKEEIQTYYHCTYIYHLIKGGYLPPEQSGSYPSDQRTCPALTGRQPHGANGYNTSHYSLSWFLSGYHDSTTWRYKPYRLNRVRRPSLTYELTEAIYWTKDSVPTQYAGKVSGGGFDLAPWPPTNIIYTGGDIRLNSASLYTNIDLIQPRHKSGINLFYTDGHGRFIQYPYDEDSTTPNNNLDQKMTF
jgi:prepilin-type N-terminal cleavage/methylation domain-containing protein